MHAHFAPYEGVGPLQAELARGSGPAVSTFLVLLTVPRAGRPADAEGHSENCPGVARPDPSGTATSTAIPPPLLLCTLPRDTAPSTHHCQAEQPYTCYQPYTCHEHFITLEN